MCRLRFRNDGEGGHGSENGWSHVSSYEFINYCDRRTCARRTVGSRSRNSGRALWVRARRKLGRANDSEYVENITVGKWCRPPIRKSARTSGTTSNRKELFAFFAWFRLQRYTAIKVEHHDRNFEISISSSHFLKDYIVLEDYLKIGGKLTKLRDNSRSVVKARRALRVTSSALRFLETTFS